MLIIEQYSLDLGGGDNDPGYYEDVVIDLQGMIIAVGIDNGNEGVITRYLSNGVLDSSANWSLENCRQHNKLAGLSMGLISAAD